MALYYMQLTKDGKELVNVPFCADSADHAANIALARLTIHDGDTARVTDNCDAEVALVKR
jgi:hypothetical protein